MEYYSAIKRNEIGSFVETWMDPRDCHTGVENKHGHQGGKVVVVVVG